MKNLLFILLLTAISYQTKAQDFGGPKVGIANFVQRMYRTKPFEGVKVLQGDEGDYIVSVVSLSKDPNKTEAVLNRIASVKAKTYASQYLNGSTVSSEVIVITNEERTKDSVITKTNLQETLKESSMGFVQSLELLTNFDSKDGKQIVFIYYAALK